MRLIKNKVFMTILATDFIQQFGIWVRNMAIMFYIMDVTSGDPLAISTLNFLEYVPLIIFTFIGGLIADRTNPKKIMLFGDFLSVISFVILGMLLSNGVVWSIFAAVLVSAIITQFSYPASQKYFKEYVAKEDVESAIGISQLMGSLFYVLGPFLGSYFYFEFGIHTTLWVLAALFFLSFMLILTLPRTAFQKIAELRFKDELKATFRYIKRKERIKQLMKIYILLSFAMGIAINLDIFIVTERLGLGERYYQLFSGVAGVGVIAGGVLFILFKQYLSNTKVLTALISVLAVTLFFEGYSTNFAFTLVLQFIDNALLGILSGYIAALMLKETRQEYLGKVNGLSSTIMYLGITLGTLFSGFAMKTVSLVFAYGVGSAALIVLVVMLSMKKKQVL
ncbi:MULTISPECIES: MFS transporter [Bacillaceae]|uniref:MFS transporter n=1 Tax=Metabacillus sediminis TaxID=3117746 RepID=A0ABZ2NFS0_9BACI|nr:MFS transporter [Bacillus sp. SJS]KZZ84836.1 hypothetical protein AS29_007175 [Bacillus sp. SJS]